MATDGNSNRPTTTSGKESDAGATNNKHKQDTEATEFFMQHRMSRSSQSTALEVAAPSLEVDKSGKAHQAGLQSLRLILLIGMVAQNSSTVLVGRYTRSSVADKSDLYEVNHLICICEFAKLLLSMALEGYTLGGVDALVDSMRLHILAKPADALKILVPALLYLVQNTLLYVALSNLTAPVFQVTYQAKLVTTALVSVVMLQRSYSPQQWICLCVLSVGVAVAVLGAGEGKDKSNADADSAKEPAHVNLVVGLTAVTIACLSSALAGVYFEKVIKVPGAEKQPASVWMRNMQLAFFSVVIAMGQGMFQGSKLPEGVSHGYFHGFTFWVWVLVALQSGGGLLVAAVIKYADNVLKGMATGVSIIVASVFSTLLLGTSLSGQFIVGATLILLSVYFFSNPLPAFIVASQGNEASALLPK